MSTEKRIAELRSLISHHNYKYHVENNPTISDKEYDGLFDELINLEKTHPELITPDSPTQKLAVVLQKDFQVAKHYAPLLSLANTYNAQELQEFDERTKRFLGLENNAKIAYSVELKYDGLSIGVVYENGILTRATTRGNGVEGENVTENIKTIRSVPLSLLGTTFPKVMEIRGEVLMPKTSFEELNKRRAQEGQSLFANPRNAAAGSMRQLDTAVTKERHLDVIFYDITFGDGLPQLLTHEDELEYLSQLGLKVSHIWSCKNIDEVSKLIPTCEKESDSYPFETDGLVIKVSNIAWKHQLGLTEHHPRGAIAYKFPSQEEITVLESIEIQVGRTGVLTPVANLQPINIGGVVVSRASLHNMEDLEEKDIRVGDNVLVKRAGEVIPYIIKSIVEKRDGSEKPFHIPTHCPVCHEHVLKLPGEVALRCINAQCPAQVKEGIGYFVSKDAMDIDGVGQAIIEKLVDSGIIHDEADLYILKDKKEELFKILYETQKSSTLLMDNILESIEKSKSNAIDRLITGLGIRFVGRKIAKVLAKKIQNVEELFSISVESLQEWEGIGEKVACSIHEYFVLPTNKNLLKRLKDAGVNMQNNNVKEEHSGILTGKKFLFTGTLPSLTRDDGERLVEEHGGSIASSVSKNLDYLVVGENAGTKLTKAKALGVTCMNEQELKDLLN